MDTFVDSLGTTRQEAVDDAETLWTTTWIVGPFGAVWASHLRLVNPEPVDRRILRALAGTVSEWVKSRQGLRTSPRSRSVAAGDGGAP